MVRLVICDIEFDLLEKWKENILANSTRDSKLKLLFNVCSFK